MRQNSDVHEEVVAELLAWAGVHPDYRSLPEAGAGRAAGRRTGHPPAAGRATDAELSELARKELDIVAAAARAVAGVRSGRRCPTTSSRCASRCRTCSRRRSCSRRPACWTPRGPSRTARSGIVPLFETIDDLQRGSSILEAVLDLPLYRARGGRARRQPGSHARLLRLQQGRRLPGRELGAVPGRARPGRVGPQDRNPVAALPRSRRHRRPRRRPELRRDPGAAAGRGERLAAHHRAG